MRISHPDTCPYCAGKGKSAVGERCPDCEGLGVVCNLCRGRDSECECPGGPPPICPHCKKLIYVCKCLFAGGK